MKYCCLFTMFACFSLPAWAFAAVDEEKITLNFSAGKGTPNPLKTEGPRLDGAMPFTKPNLALSLAPQDHVTLTVMGQTKFTGKTLAHKANFVKKGRSGGLFGSGLFSSETRKNHPDQQWSKIPKTLQVGNQSNEIQVIMEVRYRTGGTQRLCFSTAKNIDLRLPRSGDVYVFLQVPEDLVAWENRNPNAAEQQENRNLMNQRRQDYRMDEASIIGEQVLQGNVGDVQAVLVAKRGK